MRRLCALVALLVCACGGAAQPAPKAPEGQAETAPSAQPAPPGKPGAAPEHRPTIPPPPTECAAFVERKPALASGACDTPDAARKELDVAMGESDPQRRDGRLLGLEGCRALEPGLIRALRADLAPPVCGDAIVAQFEQQGAKLLKLQSVLKGLALGARLARLVTDVPRLEPPFDKPRFQQFFKTTLAPWISEQAHAVEVLSKEGVRLGGYGKGIVAIEAGLADMRFVETVRDVPLPDELARDEEWKNIYYASLDQALDPRKDRGRDAALVGLRELAAEGVLYDARVDRARMLLSKLYAGRRIDALDGLLLPALAPADYSTVERRLGARLPAFYAGIVLSDQKPSEPAFLRALIERGIAPSMRAGLDAANLSPEARELYARALVELGQRYWRSQDFERAERLLERGHGGKPPSDNARLVSALATALRGGPKDAAEMMLRGPFLPKGVGDVSELDAVSKSKGAVAGMAAYDAGYILALVPPREPNPAYWKEIANRFRRSEKLLTDPAQKKSASERAKAADDTAAAIK